MTAYPPCNLEVQAVFTDRSIWQPDLRGKYNTFLKITFMRSIATNTNQQIYETTWEIGKFVFSELKMNQRQNLRLWSLPLEHEYLPNVIDILCTFKSKE